MPQVLLTSDVELDKKLSTTYDHLHAKERVIAEKIQKYVKDEEGNTDRHAFYLHVALNFCAISALFFTLY